MFQTYPKWLIIFDHALGWRSIISLNVDDDVDVDVVSTFCIVVVCWGWTVKKQSWIELVWGAQLVLKFLVEISHYWKMPIMDWLYHELK